MFMCVCVCAIRVYMYAMLAYAMLGYAMLGYAMLIDANSHLFLEHCFIFVIVLQ